MILSVGGGNKWEYTSVLQLESHTELEMVHLENRGTCQYGNEVGGAGRVPIWMVLEVWSCTWLCSALGSRGGSGGGRRMFSL